jgi:hypothetical protein
MTFFRPAAADHVEREMPVECHILDGAVSRPHAATDGHALEARTGGAEGDKGHGPGACGQEESMSHSTKRFARPAPRFPVVDINLRCNLGCQHCIYWKAKQDDPSAHISIGRRNEIIQKFVRSQRRSAPLPQLHDHSSAVRREGCPARMAAPSAPVNCGSGGT